MGSSSSNKTLPQFFTVFQPQHSSLSLMIPSAFEDKVSGKIPNRVLLRNGLGKIWLVDVAKLDDGLYFQGPAWSKFVSENSLQMGDFMVFKYTGQRIFDVLLLGRNGCEKELVSNEEHEQLEDDQEHRADSKCRKVSTKINSGTKGYQ